MSDRTGRDWKPYERGEPVDPGNMTVLKPVEVGSKHPPHIQDGTFYLVRYECCGREAVLSHARINERRRNLMSFCVHCTQISESKESIKRERIKKKAKWAPDRADGVVMPDWCVPESLIGTQPNMQAQVTPKALLKRLRRTNCDHDFFVTAVVVAASSIMREHSVNRSFDDEAIDWFEFGLFSVEDKGVKKAVRFMGIEDASDRFKDDLLRLVSKFAMDSNIVLV